MSHFLDPNHVSAIRDLFFLTGAGIWVFFCTWILLSILLHLFWETVDFFVSWRSIYLVRKGDELAQRRFQEAQRRHPSSGHPVVQAGHRPPARKRQGQSAKTPDPKVASVAHLRQHARQRTDVPFIDWGA